MGGLEALSSQICDVTNHACRARLLKSDFKGSNEKNVLFPATHVVSECQTAQQRSDIQLEQWTVALNVVMGTNKHSDTLT